LKNISLILIGWCLSVSAAVAQTPTEIINLVKKKFVLVNSYIAEGRMKTNVSFLKVPESEVKIYFEKPDHIKVVNENGISLVPRGAVSISMNNILSTDAYTALDAGTSTIDGIPVRLVKMVPDDEKSPIVLSVLYIDVKRLLILKARTTTRDNGTYELQMQYGRYANYALPDKMQFVFNTKEYKLPKGVTFDYDDGSTKKKSATPDQTTGSVQITYHNYKVNAAVPAGIFK
jgi:outer membrane lipoprotein-sorting protein